MTKQRSDSCSTRDFTIEIIYFEFFRDRNWLLYHSPNGDCHFHEEIANYFEAVNDSNGDASDGYALADDAWMALRPIPSYWDSPLPSCTGLVHSDARTHIPVCTRIDDGIHLSIHNVEAMGMASHNWGGKCRLPQDMCAARHSDQRIAGEKIKNAQENGKIIAL
jgi:hypothetical protein